jgi:hypothetical protein
MNVEIGAEAAQFPEKEYVNRICDLLLTTSLLCTHVDKAARDHARLVLSTWYAPGALTKGTPALPCWQQLFLVPQDGLKNIQSYLEAHRVQTQQKNYGLSLVFSKNTYKDISKRRFSSD